MNLNKAFYLKKEIEEMQQSVDSLSICDSPKRQELLNKINKKADRYCEELIKINNFIDTIPDAEIRLIARYRYINNYKWIVIGDKMMLDRTACYRKLMKYLQENNTNNTNNKSYNGD